MKDRRGGPVCREAQSLRHRVRSYWQKQAPARGPGDAHRIRQAIDRVSDVSVTEVDSVSEALLLEANLVKRHQPRFNVSPEGRQELPVHQDHPGR